MGIKDRVNRLEEKFDGKIETVDLEGGGTMQVNEDEVLAALVDAIAGKDYEALDPEIQKFAEVKAGQDKCLDLIKFTLKNPTR